MSALVKDKDGYNIVGLMVPHCNDILPCLSVARIYDMTSTPLGFLLVCFEIREMPTVNTV